MDLEGVDVLYYDAEAGGTGCRGPGPEVFGSSEKFLKLYLVMQGGPGLGKFDEANGPALGIRPSTSKDTSKGRKAGILTCLISDKGGI